jgi:NitT/TauT family transport system substrate-binding protein
MIGPMDRSRRSLLALPSLLACCRRSPSSVRVAIFRGEEFTPLAQNLGYFDAEGLQVEVNEVASTSKAMQALFGDSADVVTGGYDHAIHLAAEGRTARSFVVLTARSPLALVARKIRRVEDLKGATVGISAFGSSGQHFVTYLLHRHGLSEKDVKFAATGGGHGVTVASLEHGELDAIVTLPPSLAILRARVPGLVILADGTSVEGTREVFGVDQYPGVSMMAKGEWLAANRDTAARLARAMRKTLAWVRAHSAEELQQRLRNRAGQPEELEGLRAAIASCSPDGRMPPGGPEAVREVLAASYPNIRSLDLSKTFTTEF